METSPPRIATHSPLYGSRHLHDQGDLLKTTWRSCERFGRAAVHLGKDYDMNLRFVKNHLLENSGTAFQGNREAGQWSDRNRWHKRDCFPKCEVSTSLLHSRAHQYSIAKAFVFSDSVLCLGKMGDDPVESWKSNIQWYSDNKFSRI